MTARKSKKRSAVSSGQSGAKTELHYVNRHAAGGVSLGAGDRRRRHKATPALFTLADTPKNMACSARSRARMIKPLACRQQAQKRRGRSRTSYRRTWRTSAAVRARR